MTADPGGDDPPVRGVRVEVSRPDPAEVDGWSRALIVHTAALRTDDLRAREIARRLQLHPPSTAVLILGRLVRRARDDSRAADTVTALSRALAQQRFDDDYVAQVRDGARSLADPVVEGLLAAGPAERHYDANDEPFVDKQMRSLSLGRRRALTRTNDIDVLSRLSLDQDPRVIQTLLMNPRVTEQVAVRIASRRPTHVHVLEEVLASRFGTCSSVRRAVAHSPYSPLALATRAMTGLPSQNLGQIASDDKVAARVRRQAQSLLVTRRSTAAERSERQGGEESLGSEDLGALADLIAELSGESGED